MKVPVRSSSLIALLAVVPLGEKAVLADEAVRFGRDVLPILSTNCFACHGPDEKERKAKLRLDVEENAKAEHDDGVPISPGKPGDSTILERIESTDADEMMPPPKAHKKVKPEELAILKRWIAQGAPWGRHWSFEPVVRPAIPAPAKPGWEVRNPIDSFVNAALVRKGLEPAPRADAHALLRRLSLDLIGLPPTPEMADRFAADRSPEAYEKLVDDLLARPQFGEHWARMWLDLARYADTKGYEKDLGRTMWPYRDWVVDAFNHDMPLDRFTELQIAGDLLPRTDESNLIATAFHRDTMTNEEGGTDPEEFRVAAVKDRVDTTIQVWMGLTMGCAKCHTHKYDPISNTEYYRFYAVFNETEDANRGDESPTLPIQTAAQRIEREKATQRIRELESQVTAAEAAASKDNSAANVWHALSVTNAESTGGAKLVSHADASVAAQGPIPDKAIYKVSAEVPPGDYTAVRLEILPEPLSGGQAGVGRRSNDPNFVLSEFTAELEDSGQPAKPLHFVNPRADFEQTGWPISAAIDGKRETGWAVSPRKTERHVAIFPLAEPLHVTGKAVVHFALSQQYGNGLTIARFRLSATGNAPGDLSFDTETPELRSLRDSLAKARDEAKALDARSVKLPIMRELPAAKQRVTKIQRRGNFLDPGDAVTPGILSAFGTLPSGTHVNRLAVAHWLVSPDNPLTPRVWANRIWSRLFGTGIVETEEDFGALGSAPTNQELLDWLAAEYRDRGWSLKKLVKTIVMSAAYQRDSATDAAQREADPHDLFLERGARYRLTAEAVRDQALAVSGLLSLKMGGPPVMPPQPAGLWRSTYNGTKWVDAENEDRWRRGLYTYWKRTTPYPSMTAFDAGSREVCQIRRIHTDTPLQALVTLNDPVYLEAAGALAKRMCTEAADPTGRATRGLRLALIRPLHDGEIEPLLHLRRDVQAAFEAEPDKASAFLKAARATVPQGMKAEEMAAWTVVANSILNLDEFLTRN